MTAPNSSTYDLAVIGAGSAGFSAAITAADSGARVALIGYGTIGGTCVNVGCVPSKTMIRAVETLHQARTAARFDGIRGRLNITDWAALVAQKQALVDELRQAKYQDVLPNYPNITYMPGRASFTSNTSLTVAKHQLTVTNTIIATGSRPHIPQVNGLDRVGWIDSTAALELTTLPTSMTVMGAGYIGVELAQMFARAGAKTTLVTRSRLLPGAEPEISDELTKLLTAEGINILPGLSYSSVEKATDGITLNATNTNGDTLKITSEQLLLTTGRIPNSETLNLEQTDVKTTPTGAIRINDKMATSAANIYAAGDVTGRDQFVYMAAYGARIAAQQALGLSGETYDNSAMPAVVFSDPQVASVGLTEAQAQQAGHETATSLLPLQHLPRALAARDTRGLIKLVADRKTKRLLGAHILAPEGADSIQTATMALKSGMTYEQLGATIFPYLTTVEGLKLAAQTFEKDVAKLSCCAG